MKTSDHVSPGRDIGSPGIAPDLIVLHPDDNVATALRHLPIGESARVAGSQGPLPTINPTEPIALGHKVALRALSLGDLLIKHGTPFGRSVAAIQVGEHVHVHNVASLSWETDVTDDQTSKSGE